MKMKCIASVLLIIVVLFSVFFIFKPLELQAAKKPKPTWTALWHPDYGECIPIPADCLFPTI